MNGEIKKFFMKGNNKYVKIWKLKTSLRVRHG